MTSDIFNKAQAPADPREKACATCASLKAHCGTKGAWYCATCVETVDPEFWTGERAE